MMDCAQQTHKDIQELVELCRWHRQHYKTPQENVAACSLVMIKLDAREKLSEEEINLAMSALRKHRAYYKREQLRRQKKR